MRYTNDIPYHTQREAIEKRLEIIKFFDDYGTEATRRAFGKGQSTVFLWKQKLEKPGGRLSPLALGDKTPVHKRKRHVHPYFILKYRTDHLGVDKTTITPLLKLACHSAGIKPVSASTVGRIIHDLKEKGRLPWSNKVSFNARYHKLSVREQKPKKKKAGRKGFIPQQSGDLVQMDTFSIFACGIKRYLLTAIDITTRFTFAYAYKSNSSTHGNDFLDKFTKVSPFAVKRVQTDNGSEFLKHFDHACEKNSLVHFLNYPKHPQANVYLERFNRTIQEQFAVY